MKKENITLKVINTKKVNLEKFYNYAVYIDSDFSYILVCKANIGKPEKVKCHGVVPSKGDGFNCYVGDYVSDMCKIEIYSNLKNISCMFGTIPYFTANNIHNRNIKYDLVNKLLNKFYNLV